MNAAPLRLLRPVDPGRDHIRGGDPADGDVATLVLYGDYLCPYCRSLRHVLARLRQAMAERGAYVFRHFPNERAHPGAEFMSRAAEAAGRQGRFWDMHDALYEHDPAMTEADVFDMARGLGLDMDRFARDLDSEETRARVAEDLADGQRNGGDRDADDLHRRGRLRRRLGLLFDAGGVGAAGGGEGEAHCARVRQPPRLGRPRPAAGRRRSPDLRQQPARPRLPGHHGRPIRDRPARRGPVADRRRVVLRRADGDLLPAGRPRDPSRDDHRRPHRPAGRGAADPGGHRRGAGAGPDLSGDQPGPDGRRLVGAHRHRHRLRPRLAGPCSGVAHRWACGCSSPPWRWSTTSCRC